jgi:hypothetical protein
MIKLKIIYEQLLKEVGDLENIKSYPYSNNSFSTNLGVRVNVRFQEYDNKDIEALNLNTKYYQAPIFNVVFDVEGDENQFIKTTLDEYLKIIKTVTEICIDFIKEKNPNGLTFFAASKNRNNLFQTDPQKSKFYKVIVAKQISQISGWGLVNLPLDDKFEGFMMYKK